MPNIGDRGRGENGEPLVYDGKGWRIAPDAPTAGQGVNPSAETRARLAIQYEPARDAAMAIDAIEPRMGKRERTAQFFNNMDTDGKGGLELMIAKGVGGDNFQRHQSASKTFESSVLPIMSGAAVTPTEAQRQIQAALPQFGDNPSVTSDKSRRRRQMVNSMATMARQPMPFNNNEGTRAKPIVSSNPVDYDLAPIGAFIYNPSQKKAYRKTGQGQFAPQVPANQAPAPARNRAPANRPRIISIEQVGN
jgi:hypothetical protein